MGWGIGPFDPKHTLNCRLNSASMLVQFANTGVTEFATPLFLSLLLQLGSTAIAETVWYNFFFVPGPFANLMTANMGLTMAFAISSLVGLRGSSDSSESVDLRPFCWPFLVRARFAEAATRACSVGLEPR